MSSNLPPARLLQIIRVRAPAGMKRIDIADSDSIETLFQLVCTYNVKARPLFSSLLNSLYVPLGGSRMRSGRRILFADGRWQA
jgi:hypothetical protein